MPTGTWRVWQIHRKTKYFYLWFLMLHQCKCMYFSSTELCIVSSQLSFFTFKVSTATYLHLINHAKEKLTYILALEWENWQHISFLVNHLHNTEFQYRKKCKSSTYCQILKTKLSIIKTNAKLKNRLHFECLPKTFNTLFHSKYWTWPHL